MPTLLVIEDDPQTQDIYRHKFVLPDLTLLLAENGAAGLELARQHHPTVILLDIMLPGGKNGLDVLRDIKSDSSLLDIPVVMLTNLDTESETAIAEGAAEYLIKSDHTIEEIFERLQKYFR